ncbi:MAG TPA: IMS domain-containing protein [Candidatus Obscuribacterales bacterium]
MFAKRARVLTMLALSVFLSYAGNGVVVFAQEESSLDSMWTDEPPKTGEKTESHSKPQGTSSSRSDTSTVIKSGESRSSSKAEAIKTDTDSDSFDVNANSGAPTTSSRPAATTSSGSKKDLARDAAANNSASTAGGASHQIRTEPTDTRYGAHERNRREASSSTERSANDSHSTSGPLCSLDAFKSSQLVQHGGWPGIGPFIPTLNEPNELKDAANNLLRLNVESQKIKGAELCLVRQPQAHSGFLNIQMTADYLLEALGAKPGKISDFNGELEKSKSQFTGEGAAEAVTASAGRFLVSIAPPAEEDLAKMVPETREKIALVIKVNSREASPEVIKEHSSTPAETTQRSSTGANEFTISTASAKTDSPSTSRAPAQTLASRTPPPANVRMPGDEQVKQQFVDLIKNWQTVKKSAVRQRNTSDLSQVLAGRALQRQSDAIKWLAANRKYYEMVPRSVNVSKVQDLFMGKKYACFAQVKELSKYIDEPSNKVLKESEDTYNVNYTIEKIGDRWYISDSQVIPNSAQAAASPQGKTSR